MNYRTEIQIIVIDQYHIYSEVKIKRFLNNDFCQKEIKWSWHTIQLVQNAFESYSVEISLRINLQYRF